MTSGTGTPIFLFSLIDHRCLERQDTKTNHKVAIKQAILTLDPADPNDQGVPVAVLREGAVLCKLSHPNVVKMLRIFSHDGTYNFVFELLHCNLREHMRELANQGRSWMPQAMLNTFLWQILSGLEHCHKRRIIHRDLKPDNILLTPERNVAKLADFGLSRVTDCQGGGRYTGGLMTPWYRPPEVMLGETRYDSAVDVWSLGCIFVEMMTLCPAFACNTEIECLMAVFQRLGSPDERQWPGVTRLPHFHVVPCRWHRPSSLFEVFGICQGPTEDPNPYYLNEDAFDLTVRCVYIITPAPIHVHHHATMLGFPAAIINHSRLTHAAHAYSQPNRLLSLNPQDRISASECLTDHPYIHSFAAPGLREHRELQPPNVPAIATEMDSVPGSVSGLTVESMDSRWAARLIMPMDSVLMRLRASEVDSPDP